MASRTDYYAFGSLLPGRHYSSDAYKFGFNGQEMDNEVNDAPGTSYNAEFWQYDSRLGRRWNLDPKGDPSISFYATFSLNPIMYADPYGDSVKFGGFRDKINAFFGKMFNKDFREKFKGWKESDDMHTFRKDRSSDRRLVNASRMQLPNVGANDAFDVPYGRGFGIGDISSKGLRFTATSLSIPFQLGFSIGKLSIGGISGIGIAFYNLFSAENIGWGTANRISFHNGRNMLSWGVGDYNNYNMFGQSLENSPFGAAKIHPRDALIGLRVGQGQQLRSVAFIDILGEVSTKARQYHMHINLVKEKRRPRTIGGPENTLNFSNPYPLFTRP